MRVRAAIVGAGLVTALAASEASAHVTLDPSEWEADGFARFAIRVPNERDDAATTRISVRFPDDVLSARFQPVEGWRRTEQTTRLDQPIEVEGERVTERLSTVTWSGGRIEPGEFQEFGVSFRIPDDPGAELSFPAVQEYSSGEVVRWIGPADAEAPAPVVAITEAAPEEARAAATVEPPRQAVAGAAEDDGGGDALSIVALVAGLLGLAAGLVALLRSGRRGGRGDVAAR